ncbi:sigma-70 family RNA polymerase sigma factor [Alloprevotella sp. OH1205_COT-284]|uniref:RNA polymerase sigma factor n=1 Tax=Alloprevotella sp. OH1205_COT-284 TaxID=2491043 RepID=UPI000F5E4C35|nr:sigma-70 family RNA polymerase sigma factor [Alloprevotella sp. OH1205_COT-284]RRD75472.1 sigma-70 family RNA polymerase sigma factor [Alloprevotella sp. OH1205_COT-284]
MEYFKQMADKELVNLYLFGNNEAFDCLLERYKDRLYRYILYSVRNTDLADDLFQETFVKAIVHLRQGRYSETGKFYSWLTRIAHNLMIDFFRQESGCSVVSNEENGGDVFEQIDVVESYMEAELVNEETLRDVRKLMEKLPDNQREVVFMRFYQDLSFKEIAEITGVSINTSLGRMRYALLNMRRMAKENGLSLEII